MDPYLNQLRCQIQHQFVEVAVIFDTLIAAMSTTASQLRRMRRNHEKHKYE